MRFGEGMLVGSIAASLRCVAQFARVGCVVAVATACAGCGVVGDIGGLAGVHTGPRGEERGGGQERGGEERVEVGGRVGRAPTRARGALSRFGNGGAGSAVVAEGFYPLPRHKMYLEGLSRSVAEVDAAVERYLAEHRLHLEEMLERRNDFLPIVEPVFRRYALPIELINIGLLESGFRHIARSPRGAAGVWQFVPSTARSLGLKVNILVDERLDVSRSTDAAARHFVELFDRFDDWRLVVAAYNSGVGTVSRAIKSGGTRDFFRLARQGYFRQETTDFVARFLAITKICRNAEAYGFHSKHDLTNPVAQLVRSGE